MKFEDFEKHLSLNKYHGHKGNAKHRGIGFELTYIEWTSIWMSSGFAHLRGRGKGKYCMARHGDIGPYSVDNVSIMPITQNSSDAHKGRKQTPEHMAKQKASYRKNGWHLKVPHQTT